MVETATIALPRVRRKHPSADAVALLREYGALIIEDAADACPLQTAIDELSPWFDRAFVGEGPFFGRRTKRFSGVFAKAASTASLAAEPYVLSIVEQALIADDIGEPRCEAIQLNLTQAIGICPGQRAQVLHRDEVMFPFPHDYEVMVNVMWALDRWTEDNGATRIVPRSRDWPRTRLAQAHEICTATAPRGAAIIWLGSIIHGGGENRTESVRHGLAFSYTHGWLGQSERLLLSTPPAVARTLPERVQRLIGYQVHRPNLGWVEERDPIDWLHGRIGDLAAAEDNLTPAQEALVLWRLREEGGEYA
ncbi:MAG: phytanoyl-CoA dioxygenase family protein [Hyphomonadaceae bacterium]|nr:phytanoyl-CoA dioxygenase family protein [Hyphomonadaceae bacterium]